MTEQTFGGVLLNRRESLDRTQAECAEIAGINPATWAYYEMGMRRPIRSRLPDLARALNWTQKQLLEQTGSDITSFAEHRGRRKTRISADTEFCVQRGEATRLVVRLGNPRLNGRFLHTASGTRFVLTVLVEAGCAPEDVSREWKESILRTHTGFATVDLNAAANDLRARHPEWWIFQGKPPLLTPELT